MLPINIVFYFNCIKGSSHFINFKKTIEKIEAEGILYGAGIADQL